MLLDLLFINKESILSKKKAAILTTIWIAIGLAFSIIVYMVYSYGWTHNTLNYKPNEAVLNYLTGYVIELSLSVDNLFVIAMIFKSYKVTSAFQHKVLFWGILGAFVCRVILIFFGVGLINHFSFTFYVFGLFLVYTGIKMFLPEKSDDIVQSQSKIIKYLKKFMPVTSRIYDTSFFIRKRGILIATPLFVVLIMIEITDLVFALDSIPAIIGITQDTFIIVSSNLFAIIGLRSLYYFVAHMLDSFSYLKFSLGFILAFVGFKMLIHDYWNIPISLSLCIILISLAIGVLVSMHYTPQDKSS